jgi:hypothetical protein
VTVTSFAHALVRKSERALELFVQTVTRVFRLDEPFPGVDRVSDPGVETERIEARSIDVRSPWLEEERRQARENWLRLRQQMN